MDTAKGMESLNEIDDEDLKAFLVESDEILAQFEQDVLSLENSVLNSDQLNRLYRALHTIKGNCGFLSFSKLEAIAHAGETLLDAIRTRSRPFTPQVAAVLLQLTDAIRQILQTIKTTKTEGYQDYSNLAVTLTALCTPDRVAARVEELEESDAKTSTALDSTIRVQVERLDQMMNLVGELVLARNRVLQLTAKSNNSSLISTCQQIDLITNQLQDGVMRSRMQPISTLWRNLPRLVRDVAIACGKEVTLELEGSETELDRSLVSALKDPLTHLVRNCIDHGIERPEARVAAGKSRQGTLKLRAFQESSKVTLEISDDGAGIDPNQIKLKHAQNSSMPQQVGLTRSNSISDREALDLIFLPGFSTATEVTHLSGRGVGLDVVRRNLESINGTVEVESQLGQGTTFRLRIPLTLAIIPTLLVTSDNQPFVIPQANVQELIRIEGKAQIDRSIEMLLDVPVYRLRGQLLPIVNLATVLQLSDSPTQTDVLYFVVIAVDDYRFGLIVDRIDDTQDVVVKPLSKQLKSLEMFAGATVLGDGNAALILDAMGLARQAKVQRQSQALLADSEESNDRQLILTILGPQNSRMGIVLTQATRLETVPTAAIEQVGEQYLMQYRDSIVTLIDLQAVFTGTPRPLAEFEETIEIVVVTLDSSETNGVDRKIGLIVQQILDVVEESITVTGAANRPGVQYYATVQNQITEILDLKALADLANPYRAAQKLAAGARR